MTQRKHTPSYTAEFRARGVWLFNEQRSEYRSDNAAYNAIAPKLGCALIAMQLPAVQRDGTRPPVSEMIAFIKEHRDVCGVTSRDHALHDPAGQRSRSAVFYRSPPRHSTRTWPLRMIRTKHRIAPSVTLNYVQS